MQKAGRAGSSTKAFQPDSRFTTLATFKQTRRYLSEHFPPGSVARLGFARALNLRFLFYFYGMSRIFNHFVIYFYGCKGMKVFYVISAKHRGGKLYLASSITTRKGCQINVFYDLSSASHVHLSDAFRANKSLLVVFVSMFRSPESFMNFVGF